MEEGKEMEVEICKTKGNMNQLGSAYLFKIMRILGYIVWEMYQVFHMKRLIHGQKIIGNLAFFFE